jgi:hypothetical protein
MSTPSIDETIEWVNQHHYESDDGLSCERCGGNWPCVPFRLADELEDALVEIKRLRATE